MLLRQKKEDLSSAKRKLQSGLERLFQTERQVEDLQVTLKESQPILIKTQEDIKVVVVVGGCLLCVCVCVCGRGTTISFSFCVFFVLSSSVYHSLSVRRSSVDP